MYPGGFLINYFRPPNTDINTLIWDEHLKNEYQSFSLLTEELIDQTLHSDSE